MEARATQYRQRTIGVMQQMIERIRLLRNIGPFDSVSLPTNMAFTPFTLVYAENAKGKTTLAAMLRSLANNEPELVMERQRLGAVHTPHIVLDQSNGSSMFKDGAWSNKLTDLVIYDDAFVTDNVCSGMVLETSHRRNLHELILGAKGVQLYSKLAEQVKKIEEHNIALREKRGEISESIRGPYSVEEFCSLQRDDMIDEKIAKIEQRISAVKRSDRLRSAPKFHDIELPELDIVKLNTLLSQSLPDISGVAVQRVTSHLSRLKAGAEEWVASGMTRVDSVSNSADTEICPFCAQELEKSDVFVHFQAYFSESYKSLTSSIQSAIDDVEVAHDGNAQALFERNLNAVRKIHLDWQQFTKLPDFLVDSVRISSVWSTARDAVLKHLRDKAANPLEERVLCSNTISAVNQYQELRREISGLTSQLVATNETLEQIKTQSTTDSISELTLLHKQLNAMKKRFDAKVDTLCKEFTDEVADKSNTERLRDTARDDLNRYRAQIFPTYEEAINKYLGRFNASFRIGKVKSADTRGGSTANYCVVINDHEVQLNSESGPSFRNTLSSGDRNALALAFFFASLDQDPRKSSKIVVFDDPMTSLDVHRTLATRSELFSLATTVRQVIVLSHSKQFLCALWENYHKNLLSAYCISRARNGSEITHWDVREDSINEHDKRHTLVSDYLQSANAAIEREVAQALRLILEAFVRVAYPNHFPPGSVLGPFVQKCIQSLGQFDAILEQQDINELAELLEYANQFHHDTNPAWKSQEINDTELVNMAKRTLLFTSRR